MLCAEAEWYKAGSQGSLQGQQSSVFVRVACGHVHMRCTLVACLLDLQAPRPLAVDQGLPLPAPLCACDGGCRVGERAAALNTRQYCALDGTT